MTMDVRSPEPIPNDYIPVKDITTKRVLWTTDIDWNKGSFGSDIEVSGTGPVAIIRPKALLDLHPIAHWHFNEGTGIVAADSSGNGHDGTFAPDIGVPTWDTGKLNTCLNFPGNALVLVDNSEALNIVDSISIDVWVNISNYADYNGIIGRGNTNTSYYFGTAGYNDVGMAFVYGGVSFITYNCFTLNEWIHFVATYDRPSDTYKLYKNGVLINTITGANPSVSGNEESTTIGIANYPDNDYGNIFYGLIDELAIYNRALTLDEVIARYNSGNGTELMFTGYPTSAHYETNIFDSGLADQIWRTFDVSKIVPSGTSVTIKTRVSNDSQVMGTYGNALSVGESLDLSGKYIQFSVDFTGTITERASIDYLSNIYSIPTILDVSP